MSEIKTGNRVGVHYSSYAAAHGIICVPYCNEKPTHWICTERFGDRHHACAARCEKHGRDGGENTRYTEIE